MADPVCPLCGQPIVDGQPTGWQGVWIGRDYTSVPAHRSCLEATR